VKVDVMVRHFVSVKVPEGTDVTSEEGRALVERLARDKAVAELKRMACVGIRFPGLEPQAWLDTEFVLSRSKIYPEAQFDEKKAAPFLQETCDGLEDAMFEAGWLAIEELLEAQLEPLD